MIRLFTDTNFLTENYRSMVFPLLFDLCYLKNEELSAYYSLTNDVTACDIVVFPIAYESFIKHKSALNTLIKAAKVHQKLIWLYSSGDYGFTTHIKHCYTFRLGGFHSKLNANTFILPSFINDPYPQRLPQGFSVLKKEELPSIGFVGHANSGVLKYVKELLSHVRYTYKRKLGFMLADAQSFYPSSIKRARYLQKLRLLKALKTNFILRDNYKAGVKTEADKQRSIQEFYNNIYNNAYTFCSRGVGNFSVRFYETLAVGRIPILLNTDCRLPLEHNIDWNKHVVILNPSNGIAIDQQILQFHNSLSLEAFEELQNNNRILWETHLNRPEYFLHIHNTFIKTLH